MRFSPDGTLLAVATSAGTVEVRRPPAAHAHHNGALSPSTTCDCGTSEEQGVSCAEGQVPCRPVINCVVQCPARIFQNAGRALFASPVCCFAPPLSSSAYLRAAVPHHGWRLGVHARPWGQARAAAVHRPLLPAHLQRRAHQERAPHGRWASLARPLVHSTNRQSFGALWIKRRGQQDNVERDSVF